MEQTNESTRRILVVDDDITILTSLAQRLSSWGYSVITASTGEEALKLAQEKLPHLLLLDIMLPKMKGRQLCEKLKLDPRTGTIPVIFLTALGLPDHIQAGMNLGADDYLVKPFDPDTLKQRIELCLKRYGSET